jgi:general secretion pathway protein A
VTKAQQAVQVERYEQFFGLHEPPFSLAPNPRYLFESASHAGALAQMAYAIERREPLVVITGEIGTGKTLLCRTVLDRLERKTFVSIINNPLLERDDLLNQLLQDFGVISKNRTIAAAASRHDLVHALEDFLTSLIALDAHAVVIIDEAQHVQPDVLEQIRLLSNIGDARGTMLAIILVGQPDLESVLSRPELRQVQQRVSRRIRLEPLTVAELPLYIDHRLTVGRTARSQMPGASELAHAIAEWEGSGAAVTFIPDAVEAIWCAIARSKRRAPGGCARLTPRRSTRQRPRSTCAVSLRRWQCHRFRSL